MKKGGILNQPLSNLIAATGHGDYITVSDAGLPIDPTLPKIDFCLKEGILSMKDMLSEINKDMEIERIILADEIQIKSPEQLTLYKRIFGEIAIDFVPHEEFKMETKKSRGVIRTGEFVSYSSIILIAGVIY